MEWRFREAAADYLVSGSPEAFGNEAIAFKDVFPMYGASDIRNSSRIRNRSISDDLDRELSGVTAILDQVPNQSSIPILAQALSTCRKFLDLTKKEIRASDEYRITEFLQTEIHELLEAVGSALKPRGLLNVQLRQTERGPVPFELNIRCSGTTAIRAYFGYNEPEMMLRHYVLGEQIESPQIRNGYAYRYWNEVFLEGPPEQGPPDDRNGEILAWP